MSAKLKFDKHLFFILILIAQRVPVTKKTTVSPYKGTPLVFFYVPLVNYHAYIDTNPFATTHACITKTVSTFGLIALFYYF